MAGDFGGSRRVELKIQRVELTEAVFNSVATGQKARNGVEWSRVVLGRVALFGGLGFVALDKQLMREATAPDHLLPDQADGLALLDARLC